MSNCHVFMNDTVKQKRHPHTFEKDKIIFINSSSFYLLRDQRVVKIHLFFTRKMMVGSNFSLVIHIPQGLEASIRSNVWQAIMACQLMLFVSGKSLR